MSGDDGYGPGWPRTMVATVLVMVWASIALAEESPDFAREVSPLLAKRCWACHGGLKQQGGLRLDTGAAIHRGGDSGSAIEAGNADASLLIARITAADEAERMPADSEPLPAAEIALLKAWINSGAKHPAEETPQSDPRQHWSYQPPVRPPVPAVAAAEWPLSPIDNFIAAEHERRGLIPSPDAGKAVWLRRVTLDLIGLPPTREELHAFLADESLQAHDRVVDRLLDSPRYGERWGRHWMDVWRYSDWYGRRAEGEIRYSQRHIWRWRDWIVASLNADKGYDRMIVEMLAGDEIAPTDADALAATGFLGRNWYKFDRDVWLFDTVEQTSAGLLGLTMRCARCHDHKYDPLAQEDYYRFRAFFEPHAFRIDPLPSTAINEADRGAAALLADGLSRVYDSEPDKPTYLYRRGDSRNAVTENRLTPAVPAVFGVSPAIQPVSLPVEAFYPALQPALVERRLAAASAAIAVAQQELEAARSDSARLPIAELNLAAKQAAAKAVAARVAADRAKYAGEATAGDLANGAGRAEKEAAVAAAQLELAQAEQTLAAVQAAQAGKTAESLTGAEKKSLADAEKTKTDTAAKLDKAKAELTTETEKPTGRYTPLGSEFPRSSTGRRLALANWIVDRQNPRTARVAVNHIWLRHFGEAIVPSVDNLGVSGKPPTNQPLLDWLAVELIDSGWSMKHVHRLIVTSRAYRMTSSSAPVGNHNRPLDPANQFLWRMNSRRLEAEAVRDGLLAIAGQLDLTMGGPELDAKASETSRRRSLYFRVTPDDKMEMLELFDLANPNQCYRRNESIVPQQALAMLNGPLALKLARTAARELGERDGTEGTNGTDDAGEFVAAAFETVLNRPPSEAELSASRKFLAEQAADSALRVKENLLHVLLNHHEFFTIR